MDKFTPSSADDSRSGTPNPGASNARFTSQAATTEDLLKEETLGLVNLNDFRKRRAEALERKELGGSRPDSGATTPQDGDAAAPRPLKKKRKGKKIGLSFGADDGEEDGGFATSATVTPRGHTPSDASTPAPGTDTPQAQQPFKKKKLAANASVGFKPKVMTKAALARDAAEAEALRKEFLAMRAAVKETEIIIPFVFYDGTNTPGGRCRVKKGDHVWLFLDKARKVGAELAGGRGGTGSGGDGVKTRKEWAKISVDDLMVVRGEVIVPPHYEFYYFLSNAIQGFNGPIFPYSAQPTSATPALPSSTDPAPSDAPDYDPLDPKNLKSKQSTVPDSELEGFNDDPTATKVVDRRWYERNKHIYPASIWQEYSPEKKFEPGGRKDNEGNAFFFS